MAETAKCCTAGEKQDRSNAPKTPEALASAHERPDKAKAIQVDLKHDLSVFYYSYHNIM